VDEFVKTENPDTPGQIAYEAAGLAWLSSANACPVVKVREARLSWIKEEMLVTTRPTPKAAWEFGKGLARLHRSGADGLGSPPPGFTGDGWMGMAPLSLPNLHGSWGVFYAKHRVRPYLRPFWGRDLEVLKAFCGLLDSGQLDHPQPDGVQGYARTHGDLWSGNVVWTPDGATLIDPAAQGGHAEEDIAALHMFGAPYLSKIIDGYQSVSQFASGWEDRVALHQMHILVIHSYLFGGGYVGQCVEVAASYLKSAG
jgi:Fructosamine-3-kinase